MIFRRWIIAAVLGAIAFGTSQIRAEDQSVKPLSQWTGSVENEQLEKIAPQFVTNAESLGILWKAWQVEGEVPEVDFVSSVVIVSTTRGSKLNASFQLAGNGNLKVLELGTRDLRPGFRYVLSQVSNEYVRTVNNQPLPSHVLEAEPDVVPTSLPYLPTQKVAGTIRLGGSRTMGQLLRLWANSFQEFHPKVNFEIQNEGSETALGELKKDGLALVAVSHELSPEEVKSLEKDLGKEIQTFPVCEDHIAVIVHPDNPVKELTPAQLKKILAPGADSLTWGDLGVNGEWADKPVKAHGRDEKSGTRQFLLRLAQLPKDAGKSVKEHNSYSEILEAVAKDPYAIGYSRAENVRETVKPVFVGPTSKGQTIPYITRTCQLVVALPEGKALPSPTKEFLVHAYRLEGQALLFRDGFSLLRKDVLEQQLNRLGVIDQK